MVASSAMDMETCVLIPQELSLAVAPLPLLSAEPVSVFSNTRIPQGTVLHPFQGTVRLDKICVNTCLNDNDIRLKYGCYEEISRSGRHCNWVRFLRVSPSYTEDVNMVATRIKGEPVFEATRNIPAHSEIIAFFLPHPAEDIFFLPAVTYFRNSIYRRTMDSILEDSPLDLSTSLLSRALVPSPHSVASSPPSSDLTDERKSPITLSDASSSSGELRAAAADLYPDMVDPWKPRLMGRCTKPRSQRGERNLLPCDVCGKAFDRPSLLKRHMRTHTGEKPHVCMVCNKGFSTSSSLNTHRRIHSGEKPHQCQVCGKRFTASSNLYYHRMTHIKEKPHKCSLCSKSFPTPGDLKSHMYVHNGSWPFKCHICSRGFSKHTNLKNHLFLHTGDKPHSCELCHKKFALACNLRAHMKTHEGDPQDECVRCGKVYLTGSNDCEDRMCEGCYAAAQGFPRKQSQPEYNDDSESEHSAGYPEHDEEDLH